MTLQIDLIGFSFEYKRQGDLAYFYTQSDCSSSQLMAFKLNDAFTWLYILVLMEIVVPEVEQKSFIIKK